MNSEFDIIINTRLDTSKDAMASMLGDVSAIEAGIKGYGGSINLEAKFSEGIEREMTKAKQVIQDGAVDIRRQMEDVFSSIDERRAGGDLGLSIKLNPEDNARLQNDLIDIKAMIDRISASPMQIKLTLEDGGADGTRKNIKELEQELKDLDINIGIGIDAEAEKKLQEQLKAMQEQIDEIKKDEAFVNMKNDVIEAQKASERMSRDFDEAQKSATLLSEKLITDGTTGDRLGKEELRKTGLTETEKTITRYSDDGESKILETQNDYLKAQRELYESIGKLKRQNTQIDNQAVKATEDEISALMKTKEERISLIAEARKNLEVHGLVSAEMEEELRLSGELSRIQLEIRQNKDKDIQSSRAYKDLEREINNEHKLRNREIKETEQVQQATQEQILISLNNQERLKSKIATDGLEDLQREADIRDIIYQKELEHEHERTKIAQKEEIRIAKLNEHVTDMPFDEINFRDQDAIKDFVLSLHQADAAITKITPHIDAAGNEQLKLTVTTDNSKNKLKEFQYVVDESSESLYKMSESIKPNTARMVGFVGQMKEAITKSITWGLSMELLYGNLRRFKEGIEFIKELDKELTQVKIITGMTNAETKELAKSYAALGQEMGKTAGEISKVNTELIRQGLSAEESNRRMQTVMKLSATSGMSTEQALQIATSSVNALGEDANKTADVLLKAGQISASSAEEIGEALTKMASSARASGVSVEETTALISTLVEVTQESPSSLGNSLKTLMARFNKVNAETGEMNEELNDVQKAFESVGIAFTDAEGQVKPFYDLLEELSYVWDDLDKNTKNYVATMGAGKTNLMPAHTAMCA